MKSDGKMREKPFSFGTFMNPEYYKVRFIVEHQTEWPRRFGVITACNPNGIAVDDKTNHQRTKALEDSLQLSGNEYFRVTGCSEDQVHKEPGFGVVSPSVEAIVELGRDWQQEAIFWIDNQIVNLVTCDKKVTYPLGDWSDLII